MTVNKRSISNYQMNNLKKGKRNLFIDMKFLYQVSLRFGADLYTVCDKKVSPKLFCLFLSNRSEFLHEISHIYYSFVIM